VLLSMTGHGDARSETGDLSVAVEIRTVNNRYLKISTRYPDGYSSLEGKIEKVVRAGIRRGTAQVQIRVERLNDTASYRINHDVLKSYYDQLTEATRDIDSRTPTLSDLMLLPGIVTDKAEVAVNLEADWPIIKSTIEDAVGKLVEYRTTEGASTAADLREQRAIIGSQLDQVIALAPTVVTQYRDKMLERVRDLLQANDAKIEESDLIKEVSIFADRCDINEEITRLRSHLDQFDNFLDQPESQGRKLDFLGQEIFREVNTIGSKANSVGIAHCVVEMKSAIEKIREIVQNVE
jgi:uncharacterized protein (TIGR00255 family)